MSKKSAFLMKIVSLGICICLTLSGGGSNFFIGEMPYQVHAAENETTLEEDELYAQAAVLMDAATGRILFGKNEEQIMANASTTKIMTCILALEYGNLQDYVKVSSYAAGMPRVHLGMREGQYFKLEDLLYSLMLESHNDSAVAIAEHIAGSTEKFTVLMNQKARDIGCFNTFFITPNGLDAVIKDSGEFHSTTARDLALIMSYCIGRSDKKEEFLKITRTGSHQFGSYKEKEGEMVSGSGQYSCHNHNAFLSMMEGALSGKTGFTGKAGYCYVGALERDGRTFAIALLACSWPNNKTYKWKDSRQLFEYGINNYRYQKVYRPVPTEKIAVENAVPYGKQTVETVIDKPDEDWQMLLSNEDEITVKTEQVKKLTAPVSAGEQVGQIIYSLNGQEIRVFHIKTADCIEENTYRWAIGFVGKEFVNFFKNF